MQVYVKESECARNNGSHLALRTRALQRLWQYTYCHCISLQYKRTVLQVCICIQRGIIVYISIISLFSDIHHPFIQSAASQHMIYRCACLLTTGSHLHIVCVRIVCTYIRTNMNKLSSEGLYIKIVLKRSNRKETVLHYFFTPRPLRIAKVYSFKL